MPSPTGLYRCSYTRLVRWAHQGQATKEGTEMNVIRTPAGKLRRRAAIGVVGLAALGGGGAAIAATKDSGSPAAQTSAITADAAGQLGVTPAALTAAIKKAMVDQIEAQVTAGTITKAQGTEGGGPLPQGDAPPLAPGGGGRPRGPGP